MKIKLFSSTPMAHTVLPWKSREICRAISCTLLPICSADKSTRGNSCARLLLISFSSAIHSDLLDQNAVSHPGGKLFGHGKAAHPNDLAYAFHDRPGFPFGRGQLPA